MVERGKEHLGALCVVAASPTGRAVLAALKKSSQDVDGQALMVPANGLFGSQRGAMVASRAQLGLPA